MKFLKMIKRVTFLFVSNLQCGLEIIVHVCELLSAKITNISVFLQLLEIIICTLQRSCFYGNSIKVKLAKHGIGLVCERVRENSKLDE